MTRAASHIDRGLRENLEDEARAVIIMKTVPRQGEVVMLFGADGAGGHNAGEVASAMAADRVLAVLAACLAANPLGAEAGVITEVLLQSLRYANEAIVAEAAASAERAGMATTIVVGVIAAGTLHVAWAGDSRCYLYGEGGLRRLTRDHSQCQRLIDLGLLSPVDAQFHPLCHTIDRYLGQAEGFEPEVMACRIVTGDMVLLCTDGLTDVLSDDQIAEVVRAYETGRCGLEDLPVRLVEAALAAGATDNVTALCCEYQPADLPEAYSLNMTLTGAYPVALMNVFQASKEIDHVPTA